MSVHDAEHVISVQRVDVCDSKASTVWVLAGCGVDVLALCTNSKNITD